MDANIRFCIISLLDMFDVPDSLQMNGGRFTGVPKFDGLMGQYFVDNFSNHFFKEHPSPLSSKSTWM